MLAGSRAIFCWKAEAMAATDCLHGQDSEYGMYGIKVGGWVKRGYLVRAFPDTHEFLDLPPSHKPFPDLQLM